MVKGETSFAVNCKERKALLMENFIVSFNFTIGIMCYLLGAVTAIALVVLAMFVVAITLAKVFDVASDKIVDWHKKQNRKKQFSKKY